MIPTATPHAPLRTSALPLLLAISLLTAAFAITPVGDFADNDFTVLGATNLPNPEGYVAAMFIHPDNPNILYVAAEGNRVGGKLYQLELLRDDTGRIVAMNPYDGDGPLKDPFLEVPFIDGGLLLDFDGNGFAPANLTTAMWTTYIDNTFRQYVRNVGVQIADLGELYDSEGFTDYYSTGGFAFAPGTLGDTRMIVTDYYTGAISLFSYTQPEDFLVLEFERGYLLDFEGTLAQSTAIMYIPAGNGPGFDALTMLVFDWNMGRILAFDVDADGMPVLASGRLFAESVEDAYTGVLDPITGDLMVNYTHPEFGIGTIAVITTDGGSGSVTADLTLPNGSHLLRGEPFDLTVTLIDEEGAAVILEEDAPITITALQPGKGTLRSLTSDEVPRATIPAGASSLTIRDLVYTGISRLEQHHDVLLTVRSDDDLFAPATIAVTVRDGVLTIAPDAASLPADGARSTTLRLRFTDDQSRRITQTPLRVTTSHGTLLSAAGNPLGQATTVVTNAFGEATLRLRAPETPSTATITAACRGACRATAVVDFVEPRGARPNAIDGLTLTPGDRTLTATFTLPTNVTVGDVEYRLAPVGDALPEMWTSIGGTATSTVITGLTNGVRYAVQFRAISIDPTATPGEESATAEGTPNWTTLAFALTSDAPILPADGTSEATLRARLVAPDDIPADGVILDVTATRAVLLENDATTTTLTVTTDADGRIDLGIRAPTTPGTVIITITCRNAPPCSAVITLEVTSTLASAPENLEAIPGNGAIWLIFDPAIGEVVAHQVRLDDGVWIDLPDANQPVRIDDVTNGTPVRATVRARTPDGATGTTNTVTVTPTIVSEPRANLAIARPDVPDNVPVIDGQATLALAFTFTNEGDAPLTSIWLSHFGLGADERLIDVSSSVGRITRFGERWFWRGFTLAPGASLPGTLTIEIEQP